MKLCDWSSPRNQFQGFRAALFVSVSSLLLGACASTAQRPVKQMIFASASMKAAEKAQSEKRSPDLYRRAENAYWKAQRFYVAKEYKEAGKWANEARRMAEQAELDAELKASQVSTDEE